MDLFQNSNKKKCRNVTCGYVAFPPYPKICPKCNKDFNNSSNLGLEINKNQKKGNSTKQNTTNLLTNSLKNGKKQSSNKKLSSNNAPFQLEQTNISKPDSNALNFTKMLKIQTSPDVVFSNQAYTPEIIGDIKISTSKISDSEERVKIKKKIKIKIDLSNKKIDLGKKGEYLKYMGIVSEARDIIFSLNSHFEYFLELANNLDYIATSILSGELDRMYLTPHHGQEEEMCYFLKDKIFLFIIFGKFPDKKAAWLLNQMKISFHEIFTAENLLNIEKIAKYNLNQNYQKHVLFMLEEYIKLQNIFTPNPLKSLDNFLRTDYFGLSFQSIGVISKIITNKLKIPNLPSIDSNDPDSEILMEEMKEALITAKIEAIAANTIANTSMMPHWISVKLGFQRYRFIIFSEIKKYFISLLVEGNFELKDNIIKGLKTILDEPTEHEFIGVLSDYKKIIPEIIKFLKEQ